MDALHEILAHYGMPEKNIESAITQIAQGYGAIRYLEGVNDGAESVRHAYDNENPAIEQKYYFVFKCESGRYVDAIFEEYPNDDDIKRSTNGEEYQIHCMFKLDKESFPELFDDIETNKDEVIKEVDVRTDAGGYPYIPRVEFYDYDKDIPLAKKGDKVKLIILKTNKL